MLLQRYFQIVCVVAVLLATVSSYIPRRCGVASQKTKTGCKQITIGHFRPASTIHLATKKTNLLATNELVSCVNVRSKGFPKLLIGVIATFISFSKQAAASTIDRALDVGNIKGWDMYGRVPYDDFLFSTARLANPDLLKRSFPEAVTQEIPIVLGTFNRRKAIYTGLVLAKGVVCILGGLALLGAIVMKARDRMRQDRQRETEIRGFYTPVSAAYKGARNKGREVEGVQGWIDMSRRNPRSSEQDSEEQDDEEGEDIDSDKKMGGDEKREESGPKDKGSGSDAGEGDDEGDGDSPSTGDRSTGSSKPSGPHGASDKGQDQRRPNSGTGGNKSMGPADSKGTGKDKKGDRGGGAGIAKGSKGPKGKGPKDKGDRGGSKGGSKSSDGDDDLYDV